MKILFFTKYQIDWGSSRERVGVYLDLLAGRGHRYEVIYCVSSRLSNIWIGAKGRNFIFTRIYSFWQTKVLKNFKMVWIIIIAKKFDAIFIQKLNLPRYLLRILSLRNGNLIFDCDDLCFNLTGNLSGRNNLSPYKKIIAGNAFLADVAAQLGAAGRTTVIPTPIDCRLYSYREKPAGVAPVVIGWAGSAENHLRHLRLLPPILDKLRKGHNFIFKLVGAMQSKKIRDLFDFLGERFVAVDWVELSALSEIIQGFDIGLMPLEDDAQARGKCAFKALQYMACGVAAVISPVGVNSEIVRDGWNGFLADKEPQWIEKISRLIEEPRLRLELSLNARKTVEEKFALDVTAKAFLQAIEKI
jgi:glycosyltransferase involved in cell wall biosynthesis